MSSNNDQINGLKLKLQAATKRNLRNRKAENSLRRAEISITEDISINQSECNFILEQMLDLKNQISHVAHQISTAEICSISEKFKMNHHLKSHISTHKKGYDATFARGQVSRQEVSSYKEWSSPLQLREENSIIPSSFITSIGHRFFKLKRTISELHNKDLKEKEAEKEEIERQKLAKILEQNEQKGKEAAAVESECDAIERDCSVLMKRNKAVMLKLRKKLVEAEDTRRELMKKNGLISNN